MAIRREAHITLLPLDLYQASASSSLAYVFKSRMFLLFFFFMPPMPPWWGDCVFN